VFWLNGEEQKIENPDPSMTLANYVRNVKGLKGVAVGTVGKMKRRALLNFVPLLAIYTQAPNWAAVKEAAGAAPCLSRTSPT
jgi:hypothetical protein